MEIGSGSIGVAPYINKQVIGVDKTFIGKSHSLLKQVIGDGISLPFADKSFDFVVSSDVLEHISPENRKKAVLEWLRVAKKELIIAFPEGKKSEIQDKELYEEFKKKGLSDYSEKFFKEHLEYGLPRIEEVVTWLKSKDQQVKSVNIKDNLNIPLRKFLMYGWMTKNFFVNLFFRKILLFFIPILRLFNNSPVYRKIVFIKIK